MNNATAETRRLQFSLRKALLWMVVWALYLGLMRHVGVPASIIVSVYAAVLIGIRMIWGCKRGCAIAVAASIVLALFAGAMSLQSWVVSGRDSIGLTETVGEATKIAIVSALFAVPVGYWCFVAAHWLVTAVDWIDRKMESRQPRPDK